MTVYEIMNQTICSKDILSFANNLLKFVESAMSQKNRGTVVKLFYQRLLEYSMTDYAFEDYLAEGGPTKYAIYEQDNAAAKYVQLTIPQYETPVKSLKKIAAYAREILENYCETDGDIISVTSVERIMEYLDKEYDFSDTIFCDRKAIFAILDTSHKKYNSECLICIGEEQIQQHFFLYRMRDIENEGINPEAVLFHELGHAIHARYSGSIDKVPDNIVELLEKLCMPKIDELSYAEQSEVFADILSMGMMYDSPFEKYDPFIAIHKDDKAAFHLLVNKMIDLIKERED